MRREVVRDFRGICTIQVRSGFRYPNLIFQPSQFRKCPLCDGPPVDTAFPELTVWNGSKFTYVRCGGCSSTYVDPCPSPAQFAEMYSKESYHDVYYNRFDPARHLESLRVLKRFAQSGSTLLDFGCGDGSFIA